MKISQLGFFLVSVTANKENIVSSSAHDKKSVSDLDGANEAALTQNEPNTTFLTRPRNIQGEIDSLQTWLDDLVKNKDRIVGVSAFVVAGKGPNPISVVTSGKAVIASAWDATNKKGISSQVKMVTSDSTCMMASTSKPFTWTALSMLLDAGKFNLDDPIDDILSFQIRNPSFPNVPVTYRHLYAHTSGIRGQSKLFYLSSSKYLM